MKKIFAPDKKILTRDELVKLMRKAAKYCDLVMDLQDLHFATEIRLPNGELKIVCNECTEDLGFPCTTARRITVALT